jgi:toxin secretion/phage lysis holin
MLGIVAIAVIIDRLIGDTGLIRNFIIYYLVANEGLSIIENLGEMDIIVPEFLKTKLEQLKDKGDKQ